MKKIYIFLTAVILMICMTTAANANWAEKRVLSLNEKNQDRLLLGEYHLYVFFVQETQFYKFEFENQSIESRLNVGFADEFLNYFIGKMTVSLYDENEKELAKKDIKCGYTGSISMKLEGGKMYYVYIDSTIAGNYSVVAEKLSDMGGDNWKEASEISSYNNISAAIDAPNDEDWYCFKTDSSESFFDFEIENISGGYKEFETYEYMPGTGENPLKSLKKISLYSNNSNKFDFQAKTNTIYYISVKSSSEGGYVIKSQQNIDSLSGDMKNAHRIETEKEYVSSFDGKQDYDWLKFKTSAGKAFYEIVFNRLDDGNYSTVAIYDEDGNKVTESTRLAKSININEKLEPEKFYFLCFYSEYTSNYSFIVNKKEDAVSDEKEKAREIELYQEHQSSIETSNDVDWYMLNIDGEFDLEINLLNESCSHVAIELYTERDMNLFKTNIYSSGKATKRHFVDSSGTYYIKIYGSSGNYTLSLREYGKIFEENGKKYPENISQNGRILFTIGEKEASVFGVKVVNDVAPLLRNGRTMLPARFVAEKLGANVSWYENEGKVVVKSNTVEIIIYINSRAAYVNDEKVILDSPAFIENGRTYTPVRFVAENLGATVDWIPETQQVVIVK